MSASRWRAASRRATCPATSRHSSPARPSAARGSPRSPRAVPGFDLVGTGLAAKGFGAHSSGGYDLASAFLVEALLTAGFLVVILGATDARSPAPFAPLAIGLALTLIRLISIPVTNTSVNPARSTGPALLVGRWLFAYEARDQSPGPISDMPLERLVDTDRSATPR